MKYPYGTYLFRVSNGFNSGTFERECNLSHFISEETWASMDDEEREDWLDKIGYDLALGEIHLDCLPVENATSFTK